MSHPGLPEAVVFDCDGTIADTESIADRAWTEELARYGYRPTTEEFAAIIGHPFPMNWAYFSARVDLGDRETFWAGLRARFLEHFERDLTVYADSVHAIRQLVGMGRPVAVASSSTHAHVERVLERAGLDQAVAAIVGADDVDRHKPDPQPYLTAVAMLGFDPGRCSAVEDTAVGLSSAIGAGLFSVGIVRDHGVASDLSLAHRVVGEVDLAALCHDEAWRTAQMAQPARHAEGR